MGRRASLRVVAVCREWLVSQGLMLNRDTAIDVLVKMFHDIFGCRKAIYSTSSSTVWRFHHFASSASKQFPQQALVNCYVVSSKLHLRNASRRQHGEYSIWLENTRRQLVPIAKPIKLLGLGLGLGLLTWCRHFLDRNTVVVITSWWQNCLTPSNPWHRVILTSSYKWHMWSNSVSHWLWSC